MRRQFIKACAASPQRTSALASLVALLGLVDDVDPALATNQLVVAVTAADRLQRVTDLHIRSPAAPREGRKKEKWWARLGSNQRPLRCQRSALPLSYAPGKR